MLAASKVLGSALQDLSLGSSLLMVMKASLFPWSLLQSYSVLLSQTVRFHCPHGSILHYNLPAFKILLFVSLQLLAFKILLFISLQLLAFKILLFINIHLLAFITFHQSPINGL